MASVIMPPTSFGEATSPRASKKHFDGVSGSNSRPIIGFIIEA